IVPQHLYQVAAPAAEDEEMPAMRIAPQRLLHQQRQAVEALAHVRPARRQPHPDTARNRDHRRSSTPITRASAAAPTVSSTITRYPLVSTISMRPVAPLGAELRRPASLSSRGTRGPASGAVTSGSLGRRAMPVGVVLRRAASLSSR